MLNLSPALGIGKNCDRGKMLLSVWAFETSRRKRSCVGQDSICDIRALATIGDSECHTIPEYPTDNLIILNFSQTRSKSITPNPGDHGSERPLAITNDEGPGIEAYVIRGRRDCS